MHGYGTPWQLGCAIKSLHYCSADNEMITDVQYHSFTYAVTYAHELNGIHKSANKTLSASRMKKKIIKYLTFLHIMSNTLSFLILF